MEAPLTPPYTNEELVPAVDTAPPTSESPSTTPVAVPAAAPPSPPPSQAPQAPEPPLDAPAPEPEQSPYLALFSGLAEIAATGDYAQLVQAAERADLSATHDKHVSRLLVTAPLVLAYLILDDLPPAKFALTRLPESIAAQPLPQALFSLLASTWERRYEKVYPRAEALFDLVNQSESLEAEVAAVLARLVTAFVDTFRARASALISRAYTSIPLELAGTYLGLNREQLLEAAQSQRWQYDASTDIFTPAPQPSSRVGIRAFSAPSTVATFTLVTDSVARLEA
ncbi:hypothetical protein BV25DRAFT_1823119 [Artomyces pyxidatus]|uniref:Uncharacterized protein n=1 Tax=Artomyces pyxidatus TaxID=48021 RepID=A0ACB8T7G3_9AGAM|nr:hypothetical protein BV25DRAFT_1823119 [Artomyces pyxidatus]